MYRYVLFVVCCVCFRSSMVVVGWRVFRCLLCVVTCLDLLCVDWYLRFVVLRFRLLLYVFRCCRCVLFVVE